MLLVIGMTRVFLPGAVDLSSEAGRSRERFRRAALTTVVAMGAKLIALGTAFAAIPLTLNYLGPERFGLWAAIGSVNALMEFADLGLANGLLNAVARNSAREERASLQLYVSSAFFLLLGIAILLAAAFFALAPLIPWKSIFEHPTASLIQEARQASAVFAVCFALNLPLGIVRRVQMGFQEGFSSSLWQCAGSLLALAGVLFAMRLNAGLPWLVLSLTGAPVAAMALNWTVEFTYSRAWLRPSFRWFQWRIGRELIGAGLLFFVLQAAHLLLMSADPLIAARYLGLSAVADFSVAQKLFMLAFTLQSMWLAPLWPAYGEAAARGDRRWIRSTMQRTTLTAGALSAALGAILVIFRAPIFGAWLHRDWAPSLDLSVGLALWAVALSVGGSISMFLNGVHALREQVVFVVAMTITVTFIKAQLCQRMGAAGIPWGAFAGYTLLMTPFLYALVRRLLNGQEAAC